jgi:hypothetical protein
MKTLLLILIFAVTAFSQYTPVGTSTDNPRGMPIIYFVEDASIKKTGDAVTFTGLLSAFQKTGDKVSLDKNFYLFSTFKADCQTYKWFELPRWGKWGEEINEKVEKPVERQATKGEIIHTTLQFVCKDKLLKAE